MGKYFQSNPDINAPKAVKVDIIVTVLTSICGKMSVAQLVS